MSDWGSVFPTCLTLYLFLPKVNIVKGVKMSVNSSATNSSEINHCSVVSSQTAVAVSALRVILITPVCAFVLYLGVQRWRQQRSGKSMSHSDVFAYHLAVVELLWVPSFFCFLHTYFTGLYLSEMIAFSFASIAFYGEAFFHILTCLERYLAVVHPVTYLGLKNGRIRNISIGCVWLLSFGLLSLILPYLPDFPVITIVIFSALSLVVIAFFNISILCILSQPKPGDGVGKTVRVEQSKLRAFHTITAIMGALCLWFVGFIVAVTFAKSGLLLEEVSCALMSTASIYNFPSSLVLPLLFLQRAGKLPFCN